MGNCLTSVNHSGYPDIRTSGVPDIRISGFPHFRISGFPDIGDFRKLWEAVSGQENLTKVIMSQQTFSRMLSHQTCPKELPKTATRSDEEITQKYSRRNRFDSFGFVSGAYLSTLVHRLFEILETPEVDPFDYYLYIRLVSEMFK